MIKTSHYHIDIIEDHLIENIIFDHTQVTIEMVDEIKRCNIQLAKNKPYVLLVTADPFSNITPEARKHIATKEFQQLTLAKAVVVKSLPQLIITTFYMKFDKPAILTKVFKKRAAALDWLREQLVKHYK